MRIELLDTFRDELEAQIRYIARDKPNAAKKFKKDILNRISEIPKAPFSNRPSIYYTFPDHRDLVFKGYKIVYKVDEPVDTIFVIGLVNMQQGMSAE